MILQRLDSMAVFGVYISPNMEINTLITAINQGLNNKPELAGEFGVFMTTLTAVQILDDMIHTKLAVIVDLKNQLKSAKRILELAVKAYNIGSTTTSNVMDLKPTFSGSPLATGALAILNPLKVAVENATAELQNIEDQLSEMQDEFLTMTIEFETKRKEAVDLVISKISELGNKNIVIQ